MVAACTACLQAQNRGTRGVACVWKVIASASHPNDSFDRSLKLPVSELIFITIPDIHQFLKVTLLITVLMFHTQSLN